MAGAPINQVIAYCQPVGHPGYTVIEHSCHFNIYGIPCDSVCVVTDEDMDHDRSLTMNPKGQPQSIEWRKLVIAAVPAGPGPEPPDRDNVFDERNDLYFAADGRHPVAPSVVGTASTASPYVPAVMTTNIPGRVTEGGGLTMVASSMIMVNLPPIFNNGRVVNERYDNRIGLTGKRPAGYIEGSRYDTRLWKQIDAITACYRNVLNSAMLGFDAPDEVTQSGEIDEWSILPSTDVSFPPIGYSTNKTENGLRYHSTAITDGGISAVVDWFDPTDPVRGSNDPGGQITDIKWVIPQDVVLRGAFCTYFRYHVESLGHDLGGGLQVKFAR